MLNYIWLGLVLFAVVVGGVTGRLGDVTNGAFEAAKTAVMSIALPLIGITALWLGIMRLAEKAGMIQVLARILRPVMRRLFPDVPVNHPAMGSMLMNMAANMIGLTNAATPLGLRAMSDLEKLNPHPGTATNAMCTFLAVNTSSIQLLPATAIGILAAAGSANPSAIVGTSLLATLISTVVGITAVKSLQRWPVFAVRSPLLAPADDPPPLAASATRDEELPRPGLPLWVKATLLAFVAFFGFLLVREVIQPPAEGQGGGAFIRIMNAVSLLAIPFFLSFFPLYAALARVSVYEEFVAGAKEGFQVVVRIIPYLVAILVAISMFRAAGGVDMLARGLGPVLDLVGFPTDLLPMAITRPLSGSASIGLFADLANTFGPDHLVTRMAGTLLGSTETTFYVIAVYFGSVGIRRTRHAVAAGLLADLAGIIAAVTICRMAFA